jgi:S-formylglutathione hydrolase FrmB
LFKFIVAEDPLAVIDRGFKGDLGTVFVTGARAVEGRVQDTAAKVIPQATISVEHYNRIFRLMQKGIPHEYTERPGAHTWTYWTEALPVHLSFLNKRLKRTL